MGQGCQWQLIANAQEKYAFDKIDGGKYLNGRILVVIKIICSSSSILIQATDIGEILIFSTA